jgi:hypothetical protein
LKTNSPKSEKNVIKRKNSPPNAHPLLLHVREQPYRPLKSTMKHSMLKSSISRIKSIISKKNWMSAAQNSKVRPRAGNRRFKKSAMQKRYRLNWSRVFVERLGISKLRLPVPRIGLESWRVLSRRLRLR